MGEEATKKAAGGSGSESSPDVKQRESMLLEMGKSLRTISMYPEAHPQRARLLSQSYQGIQQGLGKAGDLSVKVTKNSFLYNDIKIASSLPAVSDLAKEMHLRQVKSFSLKKELSLEDYTAFLELLLVDPEEFRKGRYIEEYIRGRQIKTVWINEIDFGRLVTAADLEEKEPEDERGPEAQPARPISQLLGIMERENDPENFSLLAREMEITIRALIEDKNHDTAWQLLSFLAAHASEEKRTGAHGEQIRALALRSVQALAKDQLLSYLVSTYGEKTGAERSVLNRTLLKLGPAVIDEVMAQIMAIESISALQTYTGLVASFGTQARETLEGYLLDQDTTRVRKAAFFLGELRDRKSVPALKGLLNHRDNKVRREASRALVRISGMEATQALVKALQKESDPEFRTIIANVLGENRVLAGVPALLNVLKGVPPREDTLNLLEAVIDALGKIGSREALPPLIKVLNKGSLLKRESSERLRIKAAIALGRLGGESAMQALAKYARRGDDPFRNTCKSILEALIANNGNPVDRIEDRL